MGKFSPASPTLNPNKGNMEPDHVDDVKPKTPNIKIPLEPVHEYIEKQNPV
jgi:hypothetical protein